MPPAITGTTISRTFTVAFFRSTTTAAISTRIAVVQNGGIWKAWSKAEETELPITWLMPHQQISPDMANNEAITERRRLPSFFTNR